MKCDNREHKHCVLKKSFVALVLDICTPIPVRSEGLYHNASGFLLEFERSEFLEHFI